MRASAPLDRSLRAVSGIASSKRASHALLIAGMSVAISATANAHAQFANQADLPNRFLYDPPETSHCIGGPVTIQYDLPLAFQGWLRRVSGRPIPNAEVRLIQEQTHIVARGRTARQITRRRTVGRARTNGRGLFAGWLHSLQVGAPVWLTIVGDTQRRTPAFDLTRCPHLYVGAVFVSESGAWFANPRPPASNAATQY